MPDRMRILADMAGRHAVDDVYDLWITAEKGCVLFGWDSHNGGQHTFSLVPDGVPQVVSRPWSPATQLTSSGMSGDGDHQPETRCELSDNGTGGSFRVVCTLPNGGLRTFEAAEASLLLPTACIAPDSTPWLAWIRCRDVENADGVIDQHNEIECAHLRDGEWIREVVADLRYGLLPLEPEAAVWGYPGQRRRPYLVPDDRGGIWLLWERKEPHDGGTSIAHGTLCGRKHVNGQWGAPVRLLDDLYMHYVPVPSGTEGGAITVVARKTCPEDRRPSCGPVVVLAVKLDGAPSLERDTGFEQWKTVDLVGRSFFVPEERQLPHQGQTYQLLFGDPHTHTALSGDAEGELSEMLAYARNKAKVDFVAVTDNDWYGDRLTNAEWYTTMAQDQAWSEDGRFIAIPGYEWTLPKWNDVQPQHRSILFASYDQPMLRHTDVEGDPMEALAAWIQTTNGILNTQHAQFQLTHSDREVNLEVCCGWSDYINHSDAFHGHLDRGFKVGFVGTSDGHRRTPGLGGGLTGLWVREFTLAGIIDAFRSRRCYATAGARIGLAFWINGTFMGETATLAAPVTARVQLQAPREIERLEIIGDGEIVAALSDLPATFDRQVAGLPVCSWYYAKATMPGGFPKYPSNVAPAAGPWAWSSPVFVEP